MAQKILLFGKTGKLGQYLFAELEKKNAQLFCPSHTECDLNNYDQLNNYVKNLSPDMIIHVAGVPMAVMDELKFFTESNSDGKEYRNKLRNTNVIGTCNLVTVCDTYDIRLVYTSSEYVFYGDETLYKTTSPVRAKNLYGKTKICGEMLVQTLKHSLIIRAPLIRDTKFEYADAYDNQFCSRQYVDIVAKSIADEVLNNNNVGIVHIVGERKSMYEIALETKNDVNKVNMKKEFECVLPLDSSLDRK